MYGAVQAIGSLDADIIDRYQAVKRRSIKIIQRCNELLDLTGGQLMLIQKEPINHQKKQPLGKY